METLPHFALRPADESNGTVLLVDDEPMLRECTAALLTALGFEVIEAVDGQEAVEKFKAHRQALVLILMDAVMPRMGGLEATRQIRELDPAAKIILSSGFMPQAQGPVQPDGFLPKPYRGKDLWEAIRKVIPDGRLAPPWMAVG